MSELVSTGPARVSEKRTVAFFADARSAKLLLTETVGKLIDSLDVQHGVVDITTVAGVDIARAFIAAGVPFELLDYGQDSHYDHGAQGEIECLTPQLRQYASAYVSMHEEELHAQAEGVLRSEVGALATIDANIVLIPAMASPESKLLDFSQGTLIGAVLTQLEEAGRDAIVIDAPERGLRPAGDGTYQRTILHVRAGSAGG